nr:alpha/beta hydrolase family protein [Amycolatopsis aidingensis]
MPTRSLPLLLAVVLVLAVPVAPAAAGTDAARVVEEIRVDERTLDLRIDSPALGGVESVRLLLPAGWSAEAARTWPVLYLLHGADADYRAWTEHTDVVAATAEAEAIIVLPEGGRCGNYSNWWNQGNHGPPAWETFHLTEVRGLLERHYRAGPQRAVAGLSMGGFGAMSYAARHPGMFRAAASYSGAVHTLIDRPRWPDGPDVIKLMRLACTGIDWRDLWGDPRIPAQREIWQRRNPYNLAAKLADTRLYVSSGNGEAGPLRPPGSGMFETVAERVVHDMGQALVGRLTELGVPVTTHFYDGGHTWPYWQRELRRSLPMLLHAIGG